MPGAAHTQAETLNKPLYQCELLHLFWGAGPEQCACVGEDKMRPLGEPVLGNCDGWLTECWEHSLYS